MTFLQAIEAGAGLLVGIPLGILVALVHRLFWEEWRTWSWLQRVVAWALLWALVWGGLSLLHQFDIR